ncbi:MAG: hypothetical protein ACK5MN_00440 [Lachnospiraceae bacterium]
MQKEKRTKHKEHDKSKKVSRIVILSMAVLVIGIAIFLFIEKGSGGAEEVPGNRGETIETTTLPQVNTKDTKILKEVATKETEAEKPPQDSDIGREGKTDEDYIINEDFILFNATDPVFLDLINHDTKLLCEELQRFLYAAAYSPYEDAAVDRNITWDFENQVLTVLLKVEASTPCYVRALYQRSDEKWTFYIIEQETESEVSEE